ncbi:hypothetical protein CVD28_12430 [Bacillus sp. M6-12]|uniref:RNA polymerase sigma factor n=1 Tax=Bacillus sp. M6-12 TaxID=2054166 RepID=UPI000C785D67|nr:RNA polymerase sigma factor [Bacillus sp. M6-12]PLS17366.1 hypothetical protein CVD28_12430 [Bacillus sp. M6-12]
MNQENQLIKKIRDGNADAFSALVKPYLATAYKTAYMVLRSREGAEDAVQNALEDAYLSIINQMDIRNFRAWFFRLVHNRSVDLYRKNARQPIIGLGENPEAELKLKSDSAQNLAIGRENKNEVMALIAQLEKDQRIPLLLYYFEDMSVKDISLALDENVNTVKTRLKRGRVKLGSLMKQNKNFLLEVNTHGI